MGKKNYPIYRIVVSETRYKRNGKYLDQVGFYNPNTVPPVFSLDQKKMAEWRSRGAIVSEGLSRILKQKKTKLTNERFP